MDQRLSFRFLIVVALVLFPLALAPATHAVDPTELEPAEGFEAGALTLEQEFSYDKYDEYRADTETNLEYAFSEKFGIRLHAPVEFDEDDDTEFGNLGLRLRYIFNPEADSAPVVSLSGEAFFPTDEDSSGMGGELTLTLSKGIGDGTNKIHGTLVGGYNNDSDDHARDFYYEALVGYSYDVSDKTTLVADFVRKQLDEHGENANIIELGIKHEFTDNFEAALGAGAGIGEESPDFTIHAGVEFKFNLK